MKAKREAGVIQIQIKGGEGKIYHPGDIVEGVVEILPDVDIPNVRKIEVKVGWETQGKGNIDRRAIEIWTRDDMPILEANIPFYQEFSAKLPNQPWSFHGHYINIVWAVIVKIDVARAKDLNASQRFVLQPRE